MTPIFSRMPDVSATLRERARLARSEAARVAARKDRVSVARLAAAAAMVVAGALAFGEPRHRALLASAAAAALVLFIVLIRATQRLDVQRRRATARATVAEQSALRAERDWPKIDPQAFTWDAQPLHADLDVTGRESLVQLLPMLSRGIGAPRLRAWLAAPAGSANGDGPRSPARIIDDLRARQAAAAELAPSIDMREAFELCARRVWLDESRVAAFIDWGRPPRDVEPRWLSVASLVLPGVSIVSIIASPLWPPFASLALTSMLVTFLLVSMARRRTREAIRSADVGAQFADAYAELAGTVLRAKFTTPRLLALQAKLAGADDALDRLNRLSVLAEVRASPMMHAALQALLAWDCQVARRVDRWRAAHGAALGDWFSAFADAECLCALGGLAYANPAWTFPDLSLAGPLSVRARALGHPLLAPETRVANDVEIGPPGSVLLISGSNMSGKSTLLRAIGLNVLLARMGAPVCAASMACPPAVLLTSLRVQDSLAGGMSYFMAEALRLRDIVFAAEQSCVDGHLPVVYLVDEILRGTNSEERAVAARYIVARLLETPAIGAITTHDLGVFDVPELAGRLHHAHFAERFQDAGDDERLVFDYRLTAGPATSRNALRLLKLIGLSPA
jgi:hypothetical protein